MKRPKISVLYKNHTWKKMKSDEELTKEVKKSYFDISFIIFDQYSPIKGPMCSILRVEDFDPDLTEMEVITKLYYNPDDTPRVDYLTMKSHTVPENLAQKYSIYPNLCQLDNYNNYAMDCSYDVIDLTLGEVIVTTSKTQHGIDMESVGSYKEKKKFFSKCGLYNSPRACIGQNMYLFLDRNTWEESSHPSGYPKHFDYVIVPIIEIDTCYMLTLEECAFFSHVGNIQYNFYTEHGEGIWDSFRDFNDKEPFTSFETVISDYDALEVSLEVVLYGFTNILIMGIAYPEYSLSMDIVVELGTDFFMNLRVAEHELGSLKLYQAVLNLMRIGTAQ